MADELSGTKLDIAVAREVMGWKVVPDPHPQMDGNTCWADATGKVMRFSPGGWNVGSRLLPLNPPFSSDIAAAWLVDAEMTKRGLLVPYARALLTQIDPLAGFETDGGWCSFYLLASVAMASPTQRCRAALSAVRASTKEAK